MNKGKETKINATYLGIIYHPELRGKLSGEAKSNIFEMLKILVNGLTACQQDNTAHNCTEHQVDVKGIDVICKKCLKGWR